MLENNLILENIFWENIFLDNIFLENICAENFSEISSVKQTEPKKNGKMSNISHPAWSCIYIYIMENKKKLTCNHLINNICIKDFSAKMHNSYKKGALRDPTNIFIRHGCLFRGDTQVPHTGYMQCFRAIFWIALFWTKRI